jgi:iron complex transport system substrate-binding protein
MKRVAALLPAATEIVYALGAFDAIAGVTHECDFPPAAASRRRLTRSVVAADGTSAEIDAEVRQQQEAGAPLFQLDERSIAEIHPDLIITQAVCDVCAVSEHDVRALASQLSPPPEVVTLDARTLDAIFSDILRIADALCHGDAGRALVAALRARLLRVHETLKAARAPRPRVAVVEWTSPLFVAGHWVPDMIHRAGGRDVLGSSGDHSRALNVADVAETHPDAVIVAPCGFTLPRAVEEGSALLAREDWAWACRCDVWAVDGNAYVSRPGPRVVDGVEIFASILHPSLFDAPPAHAAVRLVEARSG